MSLPLSKQRLVCVRRDAKLKSTAQTVNSEQ
jgi:hypothetical protein